MIAGIRSWALCRRKCIRNAPHDDLNVDDPRWSVGAADTSTPGNPAIDPLRFPQTPTGGSVVHHQFEDGPGMLLASILFFAIPAFIVIVIVAVSRRRPPPPPPWWWQPPQPPHDEREEDD
ncbi:hypothetical protein [Streptacidiphilus pinicola]|uniref:hypothetical protein n=1 Tax=Streptacidiphilus pinicola TaxID=2219663 RepID=UPI001057E961|nr:hypothetical protein [Streptacidiphilus pinicola]